MIHLNQTDIQTDQIVWKVLIYDKLGQDIISPLLKVNEIRENGITMHLALSKERLPIPDVPAVYFISPTMENIHVLAHVNLFLFM